MADQSMQTEDSAPLIRALPANHHGRDFVVGDLHGCLELLQRLLDHVRFDPTQDRLFSVGDLIDRGPDSWGTLRLIREPWCYAVLGNHELMLIECFLSYARSGTVASWEAIEDSMLWASGGEWLLGGYDPAQRRMSPEFDLSLAHILALPMLWVVGERETRFHVIHAELARSGAGYQHTHPVWLDEDIDRWLAAGSIPEHAMDCLAWSRSLMASRGAELAVYPVYEGLSTTFCGHTYDLQVRRFLSHVCLDTGAFLSAWGEPSESVPFGLTLYCVPERRCFRASYEQPTVLETRL